MTYFVWSKGLAASWISSQRLKISVKLKNNLSLLIAGMKYRTLAEKALAEEYSLTDISGITREASRANVEAMRDQTQSTG